MPIALLRDGPAGGFAPIADTPLTLGSAIECGIVDTAPGVAAVHAELRYVKGEFVLVAVDGESIEVNGRRVPLMALRNDDVLRLAPGAPAWIFRDRLAGAFMPPGLGVAAAWQGHPAFADAAEHGPDRFGLGEGVEGRDPDRCRRVVVDGVAQVVKHLAPSRTPHDAQQHLQLLQALGGAPHESLARLVDGGLVPTAGFPRRWMTTLWVAGTPARDLVQRGGVSFEQVIEILRSLAAGLDRLHRRGVVHRDLSPGNVIVPEEGPAVLIDYGQALLAGESRKASAGVVGTPGFIAPEEVVEGAPAAAPPVDIYGLAATGYALLTGTPPAYGEDVLAVLSGAARPPPRPRELGVDAPGALEEALLAGLAFDPRRRPDAHAFRASLDLVAAGPGPGGVA